MEREALSNALQEISESYAAGSESDDEMEWDD